MTKQPRKPKRKDEDLAQVIRDINVGDISGMTGGNLNIGSGIINTGAGNVNTGDARQIDIDTGGGAYIGGNVNLGGGTFIARDQVNYASTGPSRDMIEAFTKLTRAVETLNDPVKKPVAQMAIQALQTEAYKGKQADETTVNSSFDMLAGMPHTFLVIVVETFSTPIAGVAPVFKENADQLQARL